MERSQKKRKGYDYVVTMTVTPFLMAMAGITPTAFISFLSACYEDQVIDEFISRDSGLYNLMERDD